MSATHSPVNVSLSSSETPDGSPALNGEVPGPRTEQPSSHTMPPHSHCVPHGLWAFCYAVTLPDRNKKKCWSVQGPQASAPAQVTDQGQAPCQPLTRETQLSRCDCPPGQGCQPGGPPRSPLPCDPTLHSCFLCCFMRGAGDRPCGGATARHVFLRAWSGARAGACLRGVAGNRASGQVTEGTTH